MRRRLDRVACCGLVVGIGLMFSPWSWSLRVGFFVTLAFTVGFIVVSHWRPASGQS